LPVNPKGIPKQAMLILGVHENSEKSAEEVNELTISEIVG